MKRALGIVAACLLACGGNTDEPQSRAGAAPGPADAPSAAAHPDAAPLDAADFYVWDDAKGPRRDLDADLARCGEEVLASDVPREPRLLLLRASIECMERKGWTTTNR